MTTHLTPLLRYCLETTAAKLSDEFHGVFSPETVTRYVEASYADIGERPAMGPNFLPVIIERFAREQLWAVAQSTGVVEKAPPEVLFVCERNAGRSQMAACLAHHLSKGWIAVRSAGSHPDEQIDPIVVTAMAEIGLDVSREFPKPLTDAVIRAADVVGSAAASPMPRIVSGLDDRDARARRPRKQASAASRRCGSWQGRRPRFVRPR